jgi:hypothetical protein
MPLVPTPRRELIAAGAASHQLDSDLRSGRVAAPFRGVHVAATAVASRLVRLRAAVATQAPTAVVAMQTAAVLLALRWLPDHWGHPDAVVHFAVDQTDKRRHRPGLRLHRRVLLACDIVVIEGIACMSVTRTLVELARDPRVPALLVVQIIDGALRDERTTRRELLACVARFPGERGIARARVLIGRAREGVDSPQETKMRLILEDGGITELEANGKLKDDSGTVLARGDLMIRRLLIWGEYDGFGPHTEHETFRNDRPRIRFVQKRGWFAMSFVDRDLHRPGALCQEWRVAIAEAPARIAALDPARSPEVAAARRALGFGP